MAFTTFKTAGDELPASNLTSLVTEVRAVGGLQSADQTVNSGTTGTTLVNATGFAATLVASTSYWFKARFQYLSNSTADFKVGWTFPTGTTMNYSVTAFLTSGAIAIPSGIQTDVFGFGGGALSGTTDDSVIYEGIVVCGTTAGSLQAQFAQFTANAGNTTLRANSGLMLWKFA